MATNERTSVRGTTFTDANIAELEPLLRPYRVRGGPCLYVEVAPDGSKTFLASWVDPRTGRKRYERLGLWRHWLTLETARIKALEIARLKAEARAAEPSSTKPAKDSAEYQRDKRLRQAARQETVKNLTFQKRFLSWPAP